MRSKIVLDGWELFQNKSEVYRFLKLLPKYLQLKLDEKTNIGDRTAVLCSNNDNGRRFPWYRFFQSYGKDYHRWSGGFWANYFKDVKNSKLIKNVKSKDLEKVIQDPEFSDIILVGHANYNSWLASDQLVDWYDLGKMLKDHLKNGFFINTGCGIIERTQIPLGYFVVNDLGNLYGRKDRTIFGWEITNNQTLEQLDSDVNAEIQVI